MTLRSLRFLYRWHRRAGVVAAAALIYLLATGIPLQFSGALGLGSRFVDTGFVLDWYGLQAPATVRISGPVISVGDQVFVGDGDSLPVNGFRGAVENAGLLVVAGAAATTIIEPTHGTVLERLDRGASRIGLHDGRVVLDTPSGLLLADRDLVNWAPASLDTGQVQWQLLRAAPDPAARTYRERYRRRMLSEERLLQDLHSGRAFGAVGVLVVDAASLLLAFLAASGLLMWWRTPAR